MTPDELRQRRQALGLTQKQLGEAIGVPDKTIARWEQGVFPIRHAVMLTLALDRLAGAAD